MNKCPHGGIVNHCQYCLSAQDYKIVTDLNADLQTEVDRLKSENEKLRGCIRKAVEIYGIGRQPPISPPVYSERADLMNLAFYAC